ncbi:CapA family protein [Salinicoccus sesuvii]|uniref:CapA family protein n=1 Tax=Salinicoccus sesuvii TaxID=868281 RepID=A0ABV7N8B4_9STAP
MTYSKKILASNKNYKITYYCNESVKSSKCIVTFGEISSNLDEEGFGSSVILKEGMDHIYVAQKRGTQYQFLTADKFCSIVEPSLVNKEVYTYGSSLGAYCAIYYGGAIDAHILAMSPRIPAHPIIDKLMDQRFKNRGFKHEELESTERTSGRICVFYDRNNYIDNHYVDFFLRPAYPAAEYLHIQNSGHYTARALLVSGELKPVVLDFFNNKNISFTLSNDKILEWHLDTAKRRVKRGKLAHALENIEVLLSSDSTNNEEVQRIVAEYKKKLNAKETSDHKKADSKLYPQISSNELAQLDSAVSLSFVGDLTASERQTSNAYNKKTGKYEFDNMFSHVSKYMERSDFSMGIFGGPTAGETLEYSTGGRGDESSPRYNFPDSFADAVKRSGIDFVTTAHRHLLDAGTKGAMRTLDILDKVGLKHSGSFRNVKEKAELPIYSIKGLKIAILTFTVCSNGYRSSFFLKEENKHLTSILVSPSNKNFESVKTDVISKFEEVKKEAPDSIIVLSHMAQTTPQASDKMQRAWFDIFVDAGADVILNSNGNAMQPYEWRTKPNDNSNVMVLHSSGGFVNFDAEKNGEASVLTQLYLDPNTGKPFALACIPLWHHAYIDDIYSAIPINEIVNSPELRHRTTMCEYERLKDVHEAVTETMLGETLSVDQTQDKYYIFANRASDNSRGYVRNPVSTLKEVKDFKNKEIYQLLSNAKSVCFLGDSITEGTKNGGYGWFEPLVECFPHLKVERFAKGGANSGYFVNQLENITKINTDLYILAIGTNDLKHQKSDETTADKYVDNIRQVVESIRLKNKSASFILISPWTSNYNISATELSKKEHSILLEDFSGNLKRYAESAGDVFIDPNRILNENFKTGNPRIWMKDSTHPDANRGINHYSSAVMQASPQSNGRFVVLKHLLSRK